MRGARTVSETSVDASRGGRLAPDVPDCRTARDNVSHRAKHCPAMRDPCGASKFLCAVCWSGNEAAATSYVYQPVVVVVVAYQPVLTAACVNFVFFFSLLR